MKQAKGKYLTFIDSDDAYTSDHLERKVKYMESHLVVDMIHGGLKIIGSPFVKDKNDLNKKIHLSKCVVGGTFFGKKKVFTQLKGFKDLHYEGDAEFYERAKKKFNVRRMRYPSYLYYRNARGSLTNTIYRTSQ